MGRIERLVEAYTRHISLPWQRDLSGAQKAIFVVYDKTDERRLRVRMELFALATRESGHGWKGCDLTRAFAEWMAGIDYRESYFECPEDLQLRLESDFPDFLAARVREALTAEDADGETVVGVAGIASIFGFSRVSGLMEAVEKDIRGRIAVFFPGEYDKSNYRLLDARDGWNYLAVPITVHEGGIYSWR